MLDGFEILTTSGVVLWSRSYVPVNTSLVNGFIKDVFIEEKVLQSPKMIRQQKIFRTKKTSIH